MSFLLRGRKSCGGGISSSAGARPPLGSVRRSASTSNKFANPRVRASLGRKGQSMVQIQRPPKAEKQGNATAFTRQKAQTQSMSMEEVLKDLRILEEQQQEGQRRLEQSRRLKQSKSDQHVAAEQKLRRLKYKHGQDRVYQKDMHAKLSLAKKFLASARDKASKSEEELRQFDHMLKQALEAKTRLMSHYRGNGLALEKMHDLIECLKQKCEKEEANLTSMRSQYAELQRSERALRNAVRDKEAKLQKLVEEETKQRIAQTELERKIDEELRVENDIKAELKSLKQEIHERDLKRKAAAESAEKEAADHQTRLDEIETKIQQEMAMAKSQSDAILSLEEKLAKIQLTEGHISCVDETTLKAFDIGIIQQSRDAEAKSLQEEKDQKAAIEKSIEDAEAALLEVQSSKLEREMKLEELRAVYENAKKTEDLRRQRYAETIENVNKKRNDVAKLNEDLDDKRDTLRKQVSIATTERDSIMAELSTANTHLQEIKKEIQTEKVKLNALEKQLESDEMMFKEESVSIKARLDQHRRQHEALKLEYDAKCKQADEASTLCTLQDIGSDGREESDFHISATELKAAIAKLIDEHPILEEVEIGKPTEGLSLEEQIKRDLQPVIVKCETRLTCAKKVRQELQSAEKRKKEEMAQIRKAAEAEEQRQRKARDKRRKRLETDHSVKEAKKGGARRKSKSREMASAATPRELLSAFTQASFVETDESIKNAHNETRGEKDKLMQMDTIENAGIRGIYEHHGATGKEPGQAKRGKSIVETAKAIFAEDKKVRWKNFHQYQPERAIASRKPPEEDTSRFSAKPTDGIRPVASVLNKVSKSTKSGAIVNSKSRARLREESYIKPSHTSEKILHKGSANASADEKLNIAANRRIPAKATKQIVNKDPSDSFWSPTVTDQSLLDDNPENDEPRVKRTASSRNEISNRTNRKSQKVTHASKTKEATRLKSTLDKGKREKQTSSKAIKSRAGNSQQTAAQPLPEFIDVMTSQPDQQNKSSSNHSKKRQGSSLGHHAKVVRKRSKVDKEKTRSKSLDQKHTRGRKNPALSSLERPIKSRRRNRTQASSAGKSGLSSFKNDVAFSFAG